MNREIMKGAFQLMHTTNKENGQLSNFLTRKLDDQRDQLVCKEISKRNMLIRKLNMIRQNIIKAQEKASCQAKILHEYNLQKIGCKNQIKTQKMYFDIFKEDPNKKAKTNRKTFSSRNKNLMKFIETQIKGSRSITYSNRVTRRKSKLLETNSIKLPRLNFQKSRTVDRRDKKMYSNRTISHNLPSLKSKVFSMTPSQNSKIRKEAMFFIKSQVNSSNLIPFSISYEGKKRQSIKFLKYLKSLPYVCHYYLSQIQIRELPVNVISIGKKKLNDLRKVHEMLNSLKEKKQVKKSKGLCEMYDENLNLIKT
jgi:hypothetical protein